MNNIQLKIAVKKYYLVWRILSCDLLEYLFIYFWGFFLFFLNVFIFFQVSTFKEIHQVTY